MRANEFIYENFGLPYPGTYEQEHGHKTNSKQRRIGTLTTENVSNKITLKDLYNNNFPDRDEMFWDYVTKSDLDKTLSIQTITPFKLSILLISQYRVEDIDEILDLLDTEQLEIVNSYRKSPTLTNSIIVIADNKIIDGNHRALASVLNKSSINYIDLDELSNVDEGVFTGMAQRKFIPK